MIFCNYIRAVGWSNQQLYKQNSCSIFFGMRLYYLQRIRKASMMHSQYGDHPPIGLYYPQVNEKTLPLRFAVIHAFLFFKSINYVFHCSTLCMCAKMTFRSSVPRHVLRGGTGNVKRDANRFLLAGTYCPKEIKRGLQRLFLHVIFYWSLHCKSGIPSQISFPQSV